MQTVSKSHRLKEVTLNNELYGDLIYKCVTISTANEWSGLSYVTDEVARSLNYIITQLDKEKPNKHFRGNNAMSIFSIDVTLSRNGIGKRCFNLRFRTNHKFFTNHKNHDLYDYEILIKHPSHVNQLNNR